MDCPSPSPLHRISFSQMMYRDHVLNMSPRPSHHLNPVNRIVHAARPSLDKALNGWKSEKEGSVCDARASSKSSAELVKEITMLEIEIMRLEGYLLSLYRTAFPVVLDKNVQKMNGRSTGVVASDQLPRKMNSDLLKNYNDFQAQSSPTCSFAGPNGMVPVSIPKSSSTKERHTTYSRHRSLADHLGNSCFDDSLIRPDRLSEDIVRCISSIYCRLANPTLASKGCSVSSNSSFCSSSTFSPRNLSGSWSPQYNEEVSDDCNFNGLKQDSEPYAAMVEVLKLSLDDETYGYAATTLQKFRSLVKSLELVDPMKMRREEKLAFWINIHNALVMHAYLAYGAQNYIKSSSIVKAAYNVGGHCINPYDIQNSILGIRPHYSAPWLQTLLSPGKKFKTGNSSHAFAIEYPEPLVHFALCAGAYSDPWVRVYKANVVFQDLKVAKEEFIRANVYVHKGTKIYLPKILSHYAKDMSLTVGALLEVVGSCLSGIQQKAITKCVKGRPEKNVYWLEQSSSFRYLIHKEIADNRWGA